MPVRRYLRVYGGTVMGCLLAIALFNWSVDPFRVYHASFFAGAFPKNQRYLNAGLARHESYDAVIIGNSQTNHFMPSDLKQILGWNALSLSITGSSAVEQRLALDAALATGRVKRVLWGVDFVSFAVREGETVQLPAQFPVHLYHESARTPLLYLLSIGTLAESVNSLAGVGFPDLETRSRLPADHVFGRDRVFADWTRFRRGTVANAAEVDRQATQRNLSEQLASVVQAHPDIEFHLFFPPWSGLVYLHELATPRNEFAARLNFKRDVVHSVAELPNCRLYDFEGGPPIFDDLTQYEDVCHYHPRVNRLMLRAIRDGDWLVTPENCEARLNRFQQRVLAFAAGLCSPEDAAFSQLKLRPDEVARLQVQIAPSFADRPATRPR